MLRKSIAWALAALIVVQILAFCKLVQATILTTPTTVLAQVNSSAIGKVLNFSDTEAFYQELSKALKSGKPINIKTPFNSYEEFSPRLKKIFEFQRSRYSPAMGAAGAASNSFPAMGAKLNSSPVDYALSSIHYEALLSAGASTGIGAGIGGGVGTVLGGVGAGPGALFGAGVGLSVWAVSWLIANNCHKVVIKVDSTGFLSIIIETVCKSPASILKGFVHR